MAFRLVSLTLAGMTLAAALAAAPRAGVTYRNGVVAAVDPQGRRLAVDFGDGVVSLRAAEELSVATLRPGEAVLVGLRDNGGRAEAVHVRPAAGAPSGVTNVPAAALLPDAGGEDEPLGAPRRPAYVLPSEPYPPDDGDMPRAGTMKVPTISIVETPAEPLLAPPVPAGPSAAERRREEGARELEAALEAIEILAGDADRAWSRLLAACPAFGDSRPRGWLSLPASTSVPPGPCAGLLADVRAASGRVQERLRDAEDRARVMSVLPGAVRQRLAAHGLE